MSRHNIDEIIKFVLDAADNSKNKKESARLREQVWFYQAGKAGASPSDWDKFIPEPTPEQIKMESHPIQFEYCECGCHCHAAYSKGIGYTIYNSLQGKKSLSLRRGHGILGTQIGPLRDSFAECVKAAQDDFDNIP